MAASENGNDTSGPVRIGILGGTFDPIHLGHLFLAQDSMEALDLSGVWFMPSGNPPHKRDGTGRAQEEHRAEMVRRAIARDPRFSLSLEDMGFGRYSYTYLLMEKLKNEYPDVKFYFLIGADSLMNFDSWVEPGRILAACSLAAAARGHLPADVLLEKASMLTAAYGGEIRILEPRQIDISSEELRRRVKQGRSLRYFVPDSVEEYIREHGLYREKTDMGTVPRSVS